MHTCGVWMLFIAVSTALVCMHMCTHSTISHMCISVAMISLFFSFEEFFRDGARIEAAFRKYFHRASPTQDKSTIEVVVCHANVIRYFVCRYVNHERGNSNQ